MPELEAQTLEFPDQQQNRTTGRWSGIRVNLWKPGPSRLTRRTRACIRGSRRYGDRSSANPDFAACGGRSFRLRGRRAEPRYLGPFSGGRFVAADYLRALGLNLGTDHPLMLKAVGAEGEGLAVREAAAMEHRHVETVLHFSNNMKSAPRLEAGPVEARPR